MNFSKEYYLISGTLTDDQQMFSLDQENYEDGFSDVCLSKSKPIEDDITVPLRIEYPNKPYNLVDLHETPKPVLHKRVVDALSKLNILGVNFLKTRLRIKDNEIIEDYFFTHVYNRIQAVDLEKTNYDKLGRKIFLNNLVLNEDVLSEIPLEERLIFRLKESTSKYLFHKSIVEEINKLNPIGIKFYRVDEWDAGAAFR